MKKIDSFINQYSLSKTLRFKLIPYGATLDNFYARQLLEHDVELADCYAQVKVLIDEYHKRFIEDALSVIKHIDISDFSSLYYRKNKTDSEKKKFTDEAEKLRKLVSKALTAHPDYKKLFGKEIITELFPAFLEDAHQKEIVSRFDRFTTYFVGFHENRKNMYTDEEKATGIAFRCINDNLPKFLDNASVIGSILEGLSSGTVSELDAQCLALTGLSLASLFSTESFACVLTQNGISRYNDVIGGYTCTDGRKVQGLNEHINLYNQCHSKSERLPKLKMLFKQILSDRDTISFIPEKFADDDALLLSVREFYRNVLEPAATSLSEIFNSIDDYEHSGIFVKNGAAVTELSQKVSGSWHTVKDAWSLEYDLGYSGKKKKNTEKYEEEKEKAWKRAGAFSFAKLSEYLGRNVGDYFKATIDGQLCKLRDMHTFALPLLTSCYADKPRRLAKNDADIALIKNLLDAAKELEWLLKPLSAEGTDENRDEVFYGELLECTVFFRELDLLYDKVRNHITQKPYSSEKIKLTFENAQLLNGWDRNKEIANRTVLLRREGSYYLAIIDKSCPRLFEEFPETDSCGWEKMYYKQLSDPLRDLPKALFPKKSESPFPASPEILAIKERKSYLKDASSPYDCQQMIAYYQAALTSLERWSMFKFSFKRPEEYETINEFFADVKRQAYVISFKPISAGYIEQCVEEGRLYLFQIYNKDFSPHSKGTPNMHTLYFRMLFDERNLENVVYQLNGGAEMFYRFPSIRAEERVIHPANQPVKNKNPHTDKSHSSFAYDIIKDRRYTQPQFSLHLPITLNFDPQGSERIKFPVRKALKDCEHSYVIGIDRGERHLVYITVVDDQGRIVEQFSGNQIINEYNGTSHTTDYHMLLAAKEEERLKARQNWGTVENIKELKEGYISQIVHKICQLVVKYDAVIAMEDLNSGFKNSRVKVEKQVYQKFEKMLIDKLTYLVDKGLAPEENGGLLRAYQLAEKFESFKRMTLQNGFIFYVPAWLTSKIDPTTGFVDLLRPRYTSEEESKSFIAKFKSIVYDPDEQLFKFSFDYRDFPKGSTDSKGLWTICSNGERIETRRDEAANGNFVSRRVVLTDAWAQLFESAGIDYVGGDLQRQILSQHGKAFFERFMYLLRLTLQMRNSVTGTDEDYLISPVRNDEGRFYDSREYDDASCLPANADANGAYNIARKAHWAISVLKTTPDDRLSAAKLSISNKEWLAFAQRK